MNTQAQRDNRNLGNRWDSLGNSCCRIRHRIRCRNNFEGAAEVLAGNSRRRVLAEVLRNPVARIAVLVADAPDVQSSQAIPVPWV